MTHFGVPDALLAFGGLGGWPCGRLDNHPEPSTTPKCPPAGTPQKLPNPSESSNALQRPPKAFQRRALFRSERLFLWQVPMENSHGAHHCLAACFATLERRRLSVTIAIGCVVTSPPYLQPIFPVPSLSFGVDGNTAHLNLIVLLPMPPLFPLPPCDQASRIKDHRHQVAQKLGHLPPIRPPPSFLFPIYHVPTHHVSFLASLFCLLPLLASLPSASLPAPCPHALSLSLFPASPLSAMAAPRNEGCLLAVTDVKCARTRRDSESESRRGWRLQVLMPLYN